VNLFVGVLHPTGDPSPHRISWSFFFTFVQAELLSQILLRSYRVAPKCGWSKELIVALRASSHRRNLIPEPLENLETAFRHELPVLARRLIDASWQLSVGCLLFTPLQPRFPRAARSTVRAHPLPVRIALQVGERSREELRPVFG
jgi:hypothetical protein